MTESIANRIFRARKTIIDLLNDRKYDLTSITNLKTDQESFKEYNKNDNLDIFVKNATREIYVKFIKIAKAKPATLRDVISHIHTDILTLENRKILIVLLSKPNNTILKIKNEPACKNIELFWVGHLLINITKHTFVPKHELVAKSDLDTIMTKFSLSSFNQLPILLKSDPVSKYYGFESGDICKITRISQTAGETEYYRVCK